MKISFKNLAKTGIIMVISSLPALCYAQTNNTIKRDSLCLTLNRPISPTGTNNPNILKTAPSPFINIKGENKVASIVVDTEQNILYHYDNEGICQTAYLVATGKKTTPTDKGVRIVTHIEKYPYKTAPANTKRRKNPSAYGPNVICLQKIDPKTGNKSITGEFIHGNNNPSSLGKHASLGCIRMDNDVIKILSKEIQKEDIIIIK